MQEDVVNRNARSGALAAFWNDPDKRRAMALSVVLHLLVFLLLLVASLVPRPEPLPAYIVIDVGTPAHAEESVQAPTAEEPALPAPEPQVASTEIGDPRELAAPEQATTAPEEAQVTAQPPAPAAPPAEAAAAPPEPAEAAEVPAPPLPQPQVAEAAPLEEPLPLAEVPATTLPEIDPVALDPRPLADPISIPRPQARAEVSEARAVAMQPSANVSEARELSAPQPSAAVAESRPLEVPQASAAVAQSTGLAAPNATASVAPARQLEAPGVQAQVAGAVDLSSSGVQAAVSGHTPLAPPAVSALVGSRRDVAVTPQAQVAQVRDVPLPTLRAEVLAPAAQAGAPTDDGRATGATDVEATTISPRQPGGNAATAGQTGPLDPLATAAGRGRAAGPDGVGEGTGAPPQPSRPPFSTRREQPLAVLLDNVGGYPQHGLREASMIVEMPVEGGLTRLMTIYDRTDPERVGPVRSARDYFVQLAERSSAVLVHDGGSPGAMIAIGASSVPTLNAYSSGQLFARAGERSAPYNLYSLGTDLRSAVARMLPGDGRIVTGTVFAPGDGARTVSEVQVRYSGAYGSGFRYDSALGAYRWVRDGEPANHPDGQIVLMDAVLVGEITARLQPGDTAGRLYIPLDGGDATLYLRGRAVRGSWLVSDGDGIRFRTADGELVDLAPYRTWVMLTPTYDTRVER
ncbi:MAG: DUF3048 domain-containing protein [Deinococcales bacterium]|nr:DUF3048 domain-containing protein [Deinococcales bacterium]